MEFISDNGIAIQIRDARSMRAHNLAEAAIWADRIGKLRKQYIRGLIGIADYTYKRHEAISFRNHFLRLANVNSEWVVGYRNGRDWTRHWVSAHVDRSATGQEAMEALLD